MAKTQYSFSADATLRGAPRGFTVPIREVRLSAGAEFIVAIAGDIMTMPGLPRTTGGAWYLRQRRWPDRRVVLTGRRNRYRKGEALFVSDHHPIELIAPDISAYRAGNTGIDYVTTFDSGIAGPHIMVSAVTHGNELLWSGYARLLV